MIKDYDLVRIRLDYSMGQAIEVMKIWLKSLK
jgi:hypothetical protein